MKRTLIEQIGQATEQLRRAKPRSHLRLKLEIKLMDLVTKQLRKELKSAA